MTTIHTLFESGFTFQEARVDRDSGVILNVSLLGAVSANNRRYSPKAMQDAVRLYPGTRMFIDHPTDRDLRDRKGTRSIRDMCGKVLSARLAGGQVRGNVQIVGPHKAMIFDFAESMSELIGHSHRATGRVKPDGHGGMIVEGLDSVQAIELVTEPATTHGLFESVSRPTEETRAARLRESGLPAYAISDLFLESLRSAKSMTDVDGLIEDRKYVVSLGRRTPNRTREDLFGSRIEADLSDGEFSEAIDTLLGITRPRIVWNADLLDLLGESESDIDIGKAQDRLFGTRRNRRKAGPCA